MDLFLWQKWHFDCCWGPPPVVLDEENHHLLVFSIPQGKHHSYSLYHVMEEGEKNLQSQDVVINAGCHSQLEVRQLRLSVKPHQILPLYKKCKHIMACVRFNFHMR